MPQTTSPRFPLSRHGCAVAVAAALLAACGGGHDGSDATEPVAAPLASAATTLQLASDAAPDAQGAPALQPTFHAAPVVLDEPDDGDAADATASASRTPHLQAVPQGNEGLSTRRLTLQQLRSVPGARSMAAVAVGGDGMAAPQAAASVVATYTPAQIRAAYGLPALPAAGASLSAAQAAQGGAGQTIYIVDAMHDPNVAAELAAFNQKFGLASCTTKAIAATSALPLAKASAGACEFSVVYATAAGTMGTAAPAYDAGWATEIALDVQWAHATAPLARIVLIEAPDPSQASLLGAIKLANAMGPGVVSMSFGGTEGSNTAAVDAAFAGTGMSYLAATGDNGAGVSWPAVSTRVLAVGATTLSYSGSGTRSEVAWSGTGGGTSAYTPAPAYQTAAVPGMGAAARRTVADVAFNGDPSTGQYVAVQSPGSSAVGWMSVGGTSLSTPQWAGLIAVANAMRGLASQAALGAPHAVLYGSIATVPGSYASNFADVTKGSDGSCASCSARAGYDPLTGLGTPNAGALLNTLAGAAAAPVAPVVTPAAISGSAGTALSFTVSVSAPNPVTYALGGAPSGMAIASSGAVTWAVPVAGSYAVTVTARDTKTGLTGQGVYTVTVAPPQAPTVTAATVSGKPGVALSFTVNASAPHALSYSLGGAPAGMVVNSAGVVSWPSPVAGTYKVTVTAKDSTTGLSGQAVYSVQITAAATVAAGPVITAASMAGVAGKPLVGTIAIADPGATSISVTIAGAPMGMMFSVSGMTFTATWPSPVTGNYTLKVTAIDGSGRSATASVAVVITAK